MAFYEWKDINGKSYCYLRTSYRDGKEKVKHQTLGYLGSTEKAYYNGCGQCQYCGTESELWFSMCANCLADLVENEEEKASSLKAGDFEKRNRQGLCHSCLTISSPVYCWKEKKRGMHEM